MKTAGLLLLALAALLGAFVWLVPAGSFPVGFDVFWNVHVAKTWAESGFPEATPEAAFTTFAEHFVDRQIAFTGLIALAGGAELDLSLVPPLIWLLAALQALVLFACLRALRPGASPLWLLLLPALSFTWTFRNCALRDMNLAVNAILGVVTVAVLRARGRRVPAFVLFLCGVAFGFSHAFLLLPFTLGTLVVLGARRNARDVLWLLAGLVLPLFLKPDFPHCLQTAWVWNLRFPFLTVTGSLIAPSEFSPYPLADLLRWNTPFLLALGAFVYCIATKRIDAALAVPVLAMCAAAFYWRRFFEVATPLLILALADARRGRFPLLVLALAALAWPWHLHEAQRSTQVNRQTDLVAVADWVIEHGQRGDVVFVTDWALTSPLCWFTRGSGLAFTGVNDVSPMWAASPQRSDQWHAIKRAQDPDPLRTITVDFRARLLVQDIADTSPGQPAGATAEYLWQALARAEQRGWRILSAQIGRWRCYRFDPPPR
jgi:hypothetical protein